MTDIFLALLFIINGEAHVVDGHLPLKQTSMVQCRQRQKFAEKYYEDVMKSGALPTVTDIIILCDTLDNVKAYIDDYNKGISI